MTFRHRLILLFLGVATISVQATDAEHFISSLREQGWRMEGYCLSFDSTQLVLSAKTPQRPSYDLFESSFTARGGWSRPLPLKGAVNTPQDEIQPSLSSDGRDIYLIRRTIENPDSKKERQITVLCASSLADNGVWSESQPLIISNGADLTPCILPDNQTLIFASRRSEESKKQPPLLLYYTKKAGKYNWYIPQPLIATPVEGEQYSSPVYLPAEKSIRYVAETCHKRDTVRTDRTLRLPENFKPEPVMSLTGKVLQTDSTTLSTALVNVYDAITFELLQQTKVQADGSYRLALPRGICYRIDISAPDYSRAYITYDCRSLKQDSKEQLTTLLTKQIELIVNTFDVDVVAPVEAELQIRELPSRRLLPLKAKTLREGQYAVSLPLGAYYEIDLKAPCYTDTAYLIDARKDVLFSRAELDMEMRHGKTPLHVEVVDAETGETLQTMIEMANQSRKEQCFIQAAADKSYQTEVRLGDTYFFKFNAEGYFYADTLLPVATDARQLSLRVALRPLRKETVLQLSNITFEYNSSSLMESSFPQLNNVVELMKQNPNLKIELSAHTDDHGTDAYNDRLSTLRGEAAKHYLVQKGIAPERINAIGYGKRKPLVPNDTEENRAINRRVEFKVLEI